jgi:hypothetical protein
MPAEMDTAYPAYHQHNPLGDDIQAYNAYAPAPDMNFTSQDLSGINTYGALPQSHWGQWWPPTEDASLAESTNMTVPNIFAQEEPQYNDTYNPETSMQWDSPAASTHSYSVSSQATDPTGLHVSTNDIENRYSSSLIESDKRKYKRSTTEPAAPKSTIHALAKAIKQEAAPEKPKGRGSQTKPASQPKEQSSPQSDYKLDDYRKKAQERNRIVSNKFRVKKREDAKRLRADEENMEQTNRKLSSTLADLTQQVYELKMKLLQHTDCNCHLIQEYIANEAN